MINLLLTGGNGYIGSKFIEKFNNKYNITCFDTSYYGANDNLENIVFNTIKSDIRNFDSQLLDNIDYVVHMAELCNDPLSEFNPSLTQEINVDATKNFLNLCNNSGVKKFIYMSSCSVYGFSDESYVDENSNVHGLTAYADAKIKNENNMIDMDNKFETIIFRNATAYGVSKNIRLDIVLNDLVYEAVTKNSITLLSDGSPIRPLVHISDICNLIDLVINAEMPLDKNIFNIGEIGSNYTIKELAYTVAKMLKINEVSIGNTSPDQRSYRVNFEKLKSFFPNYQFEFDIEKGINELAEEYKKGNSLTNGRRIKTILRKIEKGELDNSLYWKNRDLI